ncbi:CopD family protein [Neobacillus sp. 179-C4.2 HS]|uniref:CopD family protein n=1 Tax=Neobacillus driksii TaxID=3035913 RepID=A0ABV4YX85_9BACI|nr:CopD family protein [Neobacillus sp. 179.-C4.2 HS]MDP5195825.1 CopD family protein [Neobacillus sp. 179.-C4.2 HS]
MFIAGIVSEALLYSSFSLLLGSFILNLVPKSVRPEIKIPKFVLLGAALGIAIFSFLPVLKIVLYLYEDLGLGYTLQSVLTNFEVGKTWISTGIISLILFIYLIPIRLEQKPLFSLTGLVFTLILIAFVGWSSHAASLSKMAGFLTHTAHFLAITTWVGILLVVSWFSQNHENWLKFLKWFSPLASLCLIATTITGISLMTFHMELSDYVSVTAIPYGQTLLIKHIAILPLLAFAFINSFLIRKKLMNDPSFNPLPWAKLESMIVLLVFSITGALGQASPPHELSSMIRAEGASKLFSFFHPGEINFPITFSPGIVSIILFLIAILFLALVIVSFIKKAPKALALVMSLLFILSGYIGFMLSLS